MIFRQNPESYEEKAGFFSKMLFLWLNPLLTLGNKRPLKHSDLPQLSYTWFVEMIDRQCDRSEIIYNRVTEKWEETKATKYSFLF